MIKLKLSILIMYLYCKRERGRRNYSSHLEWRVSYSILFSSWSDKR